MVHVVEANTVHGGRVHGRQDGVNRLHNFCHLHFPGCAAGNEARSLFRDVSKDAKVLFPILSTESNDAAMVNALIACHV
ncbi:hypothetical protein EON66_07620 [archaeon]|nr:MAG: hypothetical protein EON66_07620 [archaeon]